MTRAARLGRSALIVAAALAVYAAGLPNAFVHDDHEVVEAQPRPREPGDLLRVFAEPHFRGLPYYRPLTRATLLAQKGLHGDRPWAFRAVNAALAGLAGVLAWALLRSPGLAVASGPAFAAALFFALHPVASSCVYPVASGRETLLPAVVMLAALLAWLRGRRGLAWLAAAAALLAKEQAVVVPALFVWADACGVAPGRPADAAAWLRRHAPAGALLGGYAALRALVLGPTPLEVAFLEAPLGPLASLAYSLQVWLAPFARTVYEPELAVWLSPVRLGLALAATLALLAVARRRGAPASLLTFWAGWLVLAQLPTASWLRQEAAFAERYAFLAGLALPALAATAWGDGPRDPRARRLGVAAASAAIATVAALSVLRAADHRDDATFARRWLETNPASPDAHHVLGLDLARRGEHDAAVGHLEAALAGSRGAADVHVNLAASHAALGRWNAAERELRAALALDPGHPEAHANLGLALADAGRPREAERHYRAALAADPRLAEAHNNLGSLLAREGRHDEAEAHLAEALRLDPGLAAARENLARLRRARPARPDAATSD
jgi:tetratricopeptide (TPR) repeat protein